MENELTPHLQTGWDASLQIKPPKENRLSKHFLFNGDSEERQTIPDPLLDNENPDTLDQPFLLAVSSKAFLGSQMKPSPSLTSLTSPSRLTVIKPGTSSEEIESAVTASKDAENPEKGTPDIPGEKSDEEDHEKAESEKEDSIKESENCEIKEIGEDEAKESTSNTETVNENKSEAGEEGEASPKENDVEEKAEQPAASEEAATGLPSALSDSAFDSVLVGENALYHFRVGSFSTEWNISLTPTDFAAFLAKLAAEFPLLRFPLIPGALQADRKYSAKDKALLHLGVGAIEPGLSVPDQLKYMRCFALEILSHKGIVNCQATSELFGLHDFFRPLERLDFTYVHYLLLTNVSVHVRNPQSRTPVHIAALKQSHRMIAMLAEEGASLADKDVGGNTPLHFAVHSKNTEVVTLLLDQYTVPHDPENVSGMTPLMLAARENLYEIVIKLAEKGANANAKDMKLKTPLHHAVSNNNYDIVKILVENYGADINSQDANGECVLALSCRHTDDKLALYLCSQESLQVDLQDSLKADTPLHCAIANNHLSILEALLAKKANMEIKNKAEQTPLLLAVALGQTTMILRLLEAGANLSDIRDCDGNGALHVAVKNGHQHLVDALIDYGLNIDEVSAKGQTPLHVAITARKGIISSEERLALLQFLIDKGSNVQLVDHKQQGALHMAAHLPDPALCKYFLSLGCDINAKDCEGKTPIHFASLDTANVFIEDERCDLEAQDTKRQVAPLHVAAHCGHLPIVKALCAKKININILQAANCLPLHLAIVMDHETVALYLAMRPNAELNVQDKHLSTPLHYAVLKKMNNLVTYLIQQGVDVDVEDKKGLTPLQYASSQMHILVQDVLTEQQQRRNTIRL
eukprot:GCRY01000441.1.p1 GENE.GCRY01000441.1~~GCRY01000441.1.p1  ORF type:complete len:947 (+),score=270.54 GCRY01000441.1:248-2842(+)